MKITGVVKGTGAALSVYKEKVGFSPRSVRLFNVTTRTHVEWNDQMPNDAAFKDKNLGAVTYITTGGITPIASGFQIGADSDLNTSGDTIYYEACD